jgi:hypothetical protein
VIKTCAQHPQIPLRRFCADWLFVPFSYLCRLAKSKSLTKKAEQAVKMVGSLLATRWFYAELGCCTALRRSKNRISVGICAG